MKKILYFIAALSLVSAVSCVKEEAPVNSSESLTVTLGFSDATKATLSDKWGITWSAGLTLKWDGGSHKLVDADIDKGANTVSFVADGLEVGETITTENTAVYASYTQNAPGSTNWTKLFLKGVAAEPGKVTTMQIDGSILRFLPYANDEAAKAESVKSVSIKGLDKDYTVTLKDGFELSLAEITTKEESKSIFLPLAAAKYNSFTVTVNMLSGAVYTFTSGDGKKLELNENEVVNMSLPLDASHKVAEYSVTFNTDGGSAVPAQNVSEGETVTVPVGVTKDYDGSLAEGLYLGVQDPDNVLCTLEGWYTDAAKTRKYDFSTPVTAPLTLYAKWTAPENIDISTQSGDNILIKAFGYLNSLKSLTEMTDFTVVLESNIDSWSTLSLDNQYVTLTLVGAESERKLTQKNQWTLLECLNGVLVLANNITLTNSSATITNPVIHLNNKGQIVMNSGSKLCDVKNVSARGIVLINSGDNIFTLNGGQIINNTMTITTGNTFHAPVALNWGKIVINSGLIANNEVTSDVAGVAICGGIFAPDRGGDHKQITKTGGVIQDNSASFTVETGNVNHRGQQVLYRAISQKDQGVYKIDKNLSDSDNFITSDLTNSIWTSFTY